VIVGSKAFTESVILGEIAARLTGATHTREMGGTRVLWEALLNGQIDAYPEYTGTLAEELLHGAPLPAGIAATASLGFDDTYAIGLRADRAAALGVRTLSDLATHEDLRLGLSNEFLSRADGWPALRDAYALSPASVRGLDHTLALQALRDGAIDATDLYSTDAEISAYDLVALEDDRHHFPSYQAIFLYRTDLPADAVAALHSLEGRIDVTAMVRMNEAVKVRKVPEAQVAAEFLGTTAAPREDPWAALARDTRDHCALVAVSLTAAILVGIPLGILAARRPRLGRWLLGGTGVLQTIPSLALLVLLVPLLGIGGPPAVAALFLYSLLPIVRNTATGLGTLPAPLLESADALGLSSGARLRLVELPLAAPAILAGIQTAAVINVGTATIGALVGAGGYGQPILTGVRLDDVGLILRGAVPAALLALIVQGLFEALGRRWFGARFARTA
jgi:osmoprotectant transport system permease protein